MRSPVNVGIHEGAVDLLLFSPDGRLCASGGNDGGVKVLHVASGFTRSLHAHTAPVRTLCFTQDCGFVLSGGLDGKYWLATIENEHSTLIPVNHGAPVDDSSMSPIARYLVAA